MRIQITEFDKNFKFGVYGTLKCKQDDTGRQLWLISAWKCLRSERPSPPSKQITLFWLQHSTFAQNKYILS